MDNRSVALLSTLKTKIGFLPQCLVILMDQTKNEVCIARLMAVNIGNGFCTKMKTPEPSRLRSIQIIQTLCMLICGPHARDRGRMALSRVKKVDCSNQLMGVHHGKN